MSVTKTTITQQRLVFRLRGATARKRVTFTRDTVDNEHLNRKKSKICCVFHQNDPSQNHLRTE
ncbi:protein phosphatase 1 regulatory subunit 11 [Nematocida displodere]|uniref:Type 1 phosphatases regulator n=1 Tax=Nematocida displodere TaxID=1805483 RepID=A0A177EJ09_9MICR|nr:protein phosphatase 1 regulatory subunit 11 [Nematocida displodere]